MKQTISTVGPPETGTSDGAHDTRSCFGLIDQTRSGRWPKPADIPPFGRILPSILAFEARQSVACADFGREAPKHDPEAKARRIGISVQAAGLRLSKSRSDNRRSWECRPRRSARRRP